MAIEYKKIKDDLKKSIAKAMNDPLSDEEEIILNGVESYIDKEITKQFISFNSEISIDMGVYNFKYDPVSNKPYNPAISFYRIQALRNKLEQRFGSAGWKCKVVFGEDDGPNRPGIDYWVLVGKKIHRQ